jgi:hypothetical protein
MSQPQKFRFRPPTGQPGAGGGNRAEGLGGGARRARMGRGLGLTRRGGRFLFFGAPGLLPGCPGAGKLFRAPGAVPGPGSHAGQT